MTTGGLSVRTTNRRGDKMGTDLQRLRDEAELRRQVAFTEGDRDTGRRIEQRRGASLDTREAGGR